MTASNALPVVPAFVILGFISDLLWPAIERMLTQDFEPYRRPQATYRRLR